jgi:hypothetical protein
MQTALNRMASPAHQSKTKVLASVKFCVWICMCDSFNIKRDTFKKDDIASAGKFYLIGWQDRL